MITRTLTATVEISTAAMTVTSKPPAFTGENGALAVSFSFLNNGSALSIDGYRAEMFLCWPEARQMTDAVDLTVSGSTATGVFPEELTVMAGAPLLVVQLTETDTARLIVACAQPIQITNTRGNIVITTRPPTPSEIIYIGRSPYVDPVTKHWMEWSTDAGAYVDTGISPTGIVSVTKTGTNVLVDTYTITFSDGSTTTFTVTNGKGITSVTKTGSSGLTDTYTITFNDNTTTTYTVTNGISITSIAKTGTSGLVDTYTITFNNGTTTTFTVTNGSDIASITKTGASGLTDTYTVTLTDGSTTTFTVTNGRGITNIAKTGTSGNVDTYTITYNDGTTSTFTVTNGTGSVASVNGYTGDVVLNASDIPNDSNVSGAKASDALNTLKSLTGDALNGIGIPFGVCNTTAATAAKTVTVSPAITSLTVGQLILVRFDSHNEANTPTLNVNGLGAKNIANKWQTPVGPDTSRSWQDGQVVLFRCTQGEGDVHWEKITQPFMGRFVDNIYPIGSIYMSVSSTSPAILFGGAWTRITNNFLWAMDDNAVVEQTGGEMTHTLTANEMPNHVHYFRGSSYTFAWGESGNVNIQNAVAQGGPATNNRLYTMQNEWSYTGDTGGGQAHNNMPPHMNVYCWKRVA